MGDIKNHDPVLLICAVISRYDEAIQWGCRRLVEQYGQAVLESDAFDFSETKFYEKEMGTDLKKKFLAFEQLIDPSEIVECKTFTNELESEFASESTEAENRPLNLDPGYISEAKLVLATTKNRDHRIYLRDGIFAEVTLHHLRTGEWSSHRWTYPDYQRADFHEFFTRCRNHLREQLVKIRNERDGY